MSVPPYLRPAPVPMVDCATFLERYSEFRDRLLDPGLERRLRAHLGDCPSCRDYDRVIRDGVNVLRTLPGAPPSDDFDFRLQHRLLHTEDEIRSSRQRARSGLSLLGVAAVVAVVAMSPLVRPEAGMLELPPVAANVPSGPAAEAPPLLFRSGPFLSAAGPRERQGGSAALFPVPVPNVWYHPPDGLPRGSLAGWASID